MGEPRREKFTREDRLHHRREFEAVYARGTRIPGRHFILLILPNSIGRSRLGLTVGRKVGNAVVRNRTKRRLREIFRKCGAVRAAGLDIVVQARPSIAEAAFSRLDAEFEEALGRFGRKRLEGG